MFTIDEVKILRPLLYQEKSDLENLKNIAEMNDKRFTMQNELDTVNSIIAKLELL
jgi:phage major head subunit gpT-like protein